VGETQRTGHREDAMFGAIEEESLGDVVMQIQGPMMITGLDCPSRLRSPGLSREFPGCRRAARPPLETPPRQVHPKLACASARHARRFRLMASVQVRVPQVIHVTVSRNVALWLAESGGVGTWFGLGSKPLDAKEMADGDPDHGASMLLAAVRRLDG
jgi:hypothetical protein